MLVPEFFESAGTCGVDDGEARGAVDQSELFEFEEGFAEGAAVAEVAAWNDDPVGDIPAECFEDAEHDCFLSFESEGVDAVAEVDGVFGANLADSSECIIEVAADLDGFGAVVECL